MISEILPTLSCQHLELVCCTGGEGTKRECKAQPGQTQLYNEGRFASTKCKIQNLCGFALFFFFFLAEVLFFCKVIMWGGAKRYSAHLQTSSNSPKWCQSWLELFFLSDICFSSIRSPALLFALLWVLNTGRQRLIVVFLRVLKPIKCTRARGQCPGSVSFLPRRKPVRVVPRESLSQGCIPEILKFCLKEGRNVALMLFITPVFQQHKQSHPTSAALLKGSHPCLQGRSHRGNWALLYLTISLDLMGCSPFKSNFGHSLPMSPRNLFFFTSLFRNGR